MLDWTPEKGKAALKVAFVSIGALLVGANRFTNAEKGAEYKRGQEMGYFAYGGSTCIAIFPPEAKIRWDDDLMSNSQKSVSVRLWSDCKPCHRTDHQYRRFSSRRSSRSTSVLAFRKRDFVVAVLLAQCTPIPGLYKCQCLLHLQ